MLDCLILFSAPDNSYRSKLSCIMVLLLKSACLMTTPASAWVAYASEWFWLTITFLFSFGSYSQEANVPTALRPMLSPRHFNSLVLIDHVILTSASQNILVLSFPSYGWQDTVIWWSPPLEKLDEHLDVWFFRNIPNLSKLASQFKYLRMSLGFYFSRYSIKNFPTQVSVTL